jgi:hypothetical protein
MYICYVAPIGYFIFVALNVLGAKRAEQKRIRIGDIITLLALLFITGDFLYYIYLFFTKTGTLLPPHLLFLKYTGGGLLWLWVLGYTYIRHLAPHIAGIHFRARLLHLTWMIVSSLVLGLVGIVIS